MSSATPLFTWDEALHEFCLSLQATRAQKTQRYYEVQLGDFGKRHMDRSLVSRAETGKAPLTLHHEAVCAKAFFHWRQKNDIVECSLRTDYQVRHAPRPAQYMPTDADMQTLQTLLKSVHDFWNPAKNPSIRDTPVAKRVFHRGRNYAILLGLSRFSPVAVQAAKASALVPVALINGEVLLDPEFFQSLSAKADAPLKEKAKASASANESDSGMT